MLRGGRARGGFTIIELLVVIVVIGILATITIVAFNGVQQRAKYARALVSLEQWDKIVKLYYSEYGTVPMTGGGDVCLGGGYAASDDFPENSCMYNGTSLADSSPTITSSFRVISSQLPADTADIVGKLQGKFNESFRGITYQANVNSGILSVYLGLSMQGDQSCGSFYKATYVPPAYTATVTMCTDKVIEASGF